MKRTFGRQLPWYGALALAFALSAPLAAQTVTKVCAGQLTDKTVEVLYDLAGAASGGATVTIAFSDNAGSTYAINPAAATLSGAVGTGVASGTNKRIVWNAASTLAANAFGTNYRAAVTATNPSTGGGEEITITLPGSVPLVLVRIPAGTFQMGSPSTERGRYSDETLHEVTLTGDYYLGKYGVTQEQWQAVMGTAMSTACGSHGVGPSYPVYCVSWDDIATGTGSFLAKLNAYLSSTGQAGAGTFRLPTEAERERAARGGTQTRFSFGDALECDDSCGACATQDRYMWWCGNAGSASHPVGQKQPNGYGLYDIHGNVYDWCQDWYGDYPSSAQTNPTGPSSGSSRVVRGGNWDYNAQYCRSAVRINAPPGGRGSVGGFRLARSR